MDRLSITEDDLEEIINQLENFIQCHCGCMGKCLQQRELVERLKIILKDMMTI